VGLVADSDRPRARDRGPPRLSGVRVAVELLGPATLGTQRLLAHWAAGNGGVRVNEDELLSEVRTVGADEWEQAIAEAERNLPESPAMSPEQEPR